MQFTVRDLFWLTLLVSLTFGAYRQGVEGTGSWMANAIRTNGYWDDRKWMAAMFPLRDKFGTQKGAMMRVYTVPKPEPSLSGGRGNYYRIEIHHPDRTITKHFINEQP